MKITEKQKEIIRLINDEGFTLMFQKEFPKSGSWWITKNLKGGYSNSKSILKSTARNLEGLKLIELKKVDKYKHHHYKLTKLGKKTANTDCNGNTKSLSSKN
jgi:DNA-binding HxlR family transcriptional regulator